MAQLVASLGSTRERVIDWWDDWVDAHPFLTILIASVLLTVTILVFAALAYQGYVSATGYGTDCYKHCTLVGYIGDKPQYSCSIPCGGK